jgi:hypothetical protein
MCFEDGKVRGNIVPAFAGELFSCVVRKYAQNFQPKLAIIPRHRAALGIYR